MCIHYRRQVDVPGIDLLLDYRSYSVETRQTVLPWPP